MFDTYKVTTFMHNSFLWSGGCSLAVGVGVWLEHDIVFSSKNIKVYFWIWHKLLHVPVLQNSRSTRKKQQQSKQIYAMNSYSAKEMQLAFVVCLLQEAEIGVWTWKTLNHQTMIFVFSTIVHDKQPELYIDILCFLCEITNYFFSFIIYLILYHFIHWSTTVSG